jgi:hypothetical protein
MVPDILTEVFRDFLQFLEANVGIKLRNTGQSISTNEGVVTTRVSFAKVAHAEML